MKTRHLLFLLVMTSGGALLSNAQPAGKAPGTKHLQRFHRVAEPKENAFTVLVPEGWQTSGGIFRVNPATGGGALNAIGAKCDFAVERDAQGTAEIRFLPDYSFQDMRGSPAGNMGLFPPGSNYNGATVYPVMDPATFLSTVAFRYAHPRAAAPQVLERTPLPAMVEEMRAEAQGIPIPYQYAAGMISIVYSEGGVRYKEKIAGGIVSHPQQSGGTWGNKKTLLVRAPVDEFDSLAPIFSIIHTSVKLNLQWLAGEIQGQNYRAAKAAHIQSEIQNIEREMVEHRQRTNAEINNDMYMALTGQEDYINPFTKEVERGSNEWKYRWETPNGDVVYADTESYDPNFDPDDKRTGFKRSTVRSR